MSVLSRMVKQRKEAAEHFIKGGREDLAKKEEEEIEILGDYLPKPLSDEELSELIATAIKKTGASSPQQMGLVMKEIKEKAAGRVDGKVLADKVKATLAS